MKAATLACLLAPVAVMASPCRHSPATSAMAYPTAPMPSTPSGTSPSTASTAASSSAVSSVTTSSVAVPTAEPTTSERPSNPSTTSKATPSAKPSAKPSPSSDSIDELFKARGKQYFGAASDGYTFNRSPQTAALLKKDFGQLTPENSMKWDAIEPRKGAFSFSGSDALVDYAMENGKIVHGHTLLWYQQLPDWVKSIKSADELTKVIQNHITTIVTRYKGKVHAWDVVNEIFTEEGNLRDCVFTQLLGEDFVRIAFEAAHAADPEAKLYINEFHLESGSSPKVMAMSKYVKKWLAAGLPVHGIGLQGHLGGGNPSAAEMQAGMELLAKTGVEELAITELDIVGAPVDEYVRVTEACLAVDACVGITVWGVGDADSWLSKDTPLLFDANYQPKPAYDAIVKLLS